MEQQPTTEPQPTTVVNNVVSESGREAIDQAREYESVFAPTTLTFDDGTTLEIPPHPSLRMFETEEQLEDYDELMFEIESYDHHKIELPVRTIKEKDGTEMVLPAETKDGPLMVPFRKDGQLIKGHDAKVVRIALGDEKYKLLKTKTINGRRAGYADVQRAWNEQGARVRERQQRDSKSTGSSSDLAAVAATDSQ